VERHLHRRQGGIAGCVCYAVKLCDSDVACARESSNTHFTLPTSHYILHSSHFTLHTATLHSATHHTTRITLHTSHFTLHTSQFTPYRPRGHALRTLPPRLVVHIFRTNTPPATYSTYLCVRAPLLSRDVCRVQCDTRASGAQVYCNKIRKYS